MTVLTFPSTGGVKSDKVPLVDDVDPQQQQPTKSISPKLLESGEPRNFDVNVRRDRQVKHNQELLLKKIKRIMVLVLALAVMWLSVYYYMRYECGDCTLDYDGTFKLNTAAMASANSQNQLPDIDDRSNGDGNDDDDDDDDDDRVPCKIYHSYAAAESDMALPVTTSSPAVDGLTFTLAGTAADYDSSQFNDMEDVYKKLEKFALNKALNRKDALTTLTDDDVISVIKEEFEIDPKVGKVVQPIIITKSARFIHDFSVNITGIVDVEGQRCFVMPLMRNSVSPPVSLYDLLFKMSSGYYSMDIKKVVGNMRIVKPALKDLSDYGLYISKDCADYSTFKLEKAVGATDL